jgi:hypothetical protein
MFMQLLPCCRPCECAAVAAAASAVRMMYLKGGKALLFGGFYDTGRDVK